MAEQLSPGTEFTEPRSGAPVISAASSSIASIVGICERGPINRPVLIGGYDKFTKIFGSRVYGSYVPGSVKGFFDNGGKSLYIVRVGHYTTITDASTLDAVKATLQLLGDGASNTALISASSHGLHGNALGLSTVRQDSLIGTAAAGFPGVASSVVVSDVRRLYVGAQVRLTNGVNNARGVVSRIDETSKTIYFTAAVTPLAAAVAAPASVYLEEVDFLVYRNGSFQKRYAQLAMSTLSGSKYFKDAINTNDPEDQIEVTTDNAHTLTSSSDPRPVDITNTAFASGSDGTLPNDTDHVGSTSSKTGLYALDSVDDVVNVAIPGKVSATVHNAMLAYTEGRKDMFAVLDTNVAQTPAAVKTSIQTTENLYSEYGAVYYPWLKITDQDTGLLTLYPPSGFIMGVFARNDAARGVQKAPAGTPDGRLVNVLGPERDLDKTDRDSLYPANINPIISMAGRGTVIYGARTLSTGDFRSLNIRRVFNFLKRSLDEGTKFIVFEPNDADTRALVRKTVGAFLLRQWRRKVLMGAKAADAFFITCDETNNPPSVQNAGQLICRIGLAVAKPAEFITFELVQDTRALDAELNAAGVA